MMNRAQHQTNYRILTYVSVTISILVELCGALSNVLFLLTLSLRYYTLTASEVKCDVSMNVYT